MSFMKRPDIARAAQEAGLASKRTRWRDAKEARHHRHSLLLLDPRVLGLLSEPFRDANADATINGSANKAHFLHLFEQLYKLSFKPARRQAQANGRSKRTERAPAAAEKHGSRV